MVQLTNRRNMETQSLKIENNLVIDIETGEILGEAINDNGAIASQEALETVLKKISEVESQYTALKSKHEFILANCKKIEERKASYLAYLKGCYSPAIELYAKGRLEGQKTKTLLTPYGQVSFRLVRGGLKVTDKAVALETALGLGMTNAVKITQEFQISRLTDEQLDALYYSLPEGFEFVEDRESMSIKVVG
jgi:hypothetical protein